jgi:multicomponent Na+:H+ antiporter subunit C
MTDAYAVTSGLVFGLSLYGLLVGDGLLRRLMAANVMASSVFLYLVVVSTGQGDIARDPVPQAMVLTGIVIALAVTAFALGLARWLQAEEDGAAGRQEAAHGGERATPAHD